MICAVPSYLMTFVVILFFMIYHHLVANISSSVYSIHFLLLEHLKNEGNESISRVYIQQNDALTPFLHHLWRRLLWRWREMPCE